MNPFPTEASIKADTIIGYAEILTCTPESFQACENEQEKGNSSSVRGLQFSDVHDDQLGSLRTFPILMQHPTMTNFRRPNLKTKNATYPSTCNNYSMNRLKAGHKRKL